MSHESLHSWEKELPPVPSTQDATLLKPKSLNRKNVKNLTFLSIQQDSSEPLKLSKSSLGGRRAPPMLDLNQRGFSSSSLGQDDPVLAFQELKLSPATVNESIRPQIGQKRQTIVSSYSPTRSVSSQEGTIASSLPTTPLASTTSSNSLKDKDLVHLKELGAGNYGSVLKVFHVPLQKTMARKIVSIDSKLTTQTQIIRELRIMHECRSPHIVEFYGAYLRSNNTVVLCMEYCNCGSVDKLANMLSDKAFPLSVLKVLLFSILSGLYYLYDTHKIIHRDIKPSNVLMTHRGEFKLCDFGVSRELTNSVALADTFVGTSTYMSPERIQGNMYSIKSDVWSTGLMLYELASGLSPWSDPEAGHLTGIRSSKVIGPEGILDLLQRIVNEQSPSLLNKEDQFTRKIFDSDMCRFIDKCLVKDEEHRLSPQDLLQDPFLESVAIGTFDKEVKCWAKLIRKQLKEDN